MNKQLVTISMLFYIAGLSIHGLAADDTAKTSEKKSSITWKHGVAVQDRKALYIDPIRLESRYLFISEESIINCKNEIIKAGLLLWGENLWIYDFRKDRPYRQLWDTERTLFYKIENNRSMLSEDGNDWDVLQVEIVDDRERPPSGPERIVVYMIVHLECRWFNGDYEISSVPD